MQSPFFNDKILNFQRMGRNKDGTSGRADYPTDLLEENIALRYKRAEEDEFDSIHIDLADALAPNGRLYVRTVVSGLKQGVWTRQSSFYIVGKPGLIVRETTEEGAISETFFDTPVDLCNLVMPKHAVSRIQHQQASPDSPRYTFLRFGESKFFDVTMHDPDGVLLAEGSAHIDEDGEMTSAGLWVSYKNGFLVPNEFSYYTTTGQDKRIGRDIRDVFMEQRKILLRYVPEHDPALLDERALNRAVEDVFGYCMNGYGITPCVGEGAVRLLQRLYLSDGFADDPHGIYHTLSLPDTAFTLTAPNEPPFSAEGWAIVPKLQPQ